MFEEKEPMIDLKSLPKKPEDALQTLLQELIAIIPRGTGSFQDFSQKVRKRADDIKLTLRAASVASRRVQDPQLASLAQEKLQIDDSTSLTSLHDDVETVLEALFVTQFDQHFLGESDVADFDQVQLSTDEKSDIRELLTKARTLTDSANYLSDDHKRRISHRIADVENELYKEVSGFKAFLAAAADVSGLVRKFGDDAQPLAEAIMKARTITEQKVEGYKRIEEQEKPKQLPSPENTDVD